MAEMRKADPDKVKELFDWFLAKGVSFKSISFASGYTQNGLTQAIARNDMTEAMYRASLALRLEMGVDAKGPCIFIVRVPEIRAQAVEALLNSVADISYTCETIR